MDVVKRQWVFIDDHGVSYMHRTGMFMINVSDGDVPDSQVGVIVLLTSPGGYTVQWFMSVSKVRC